MTAYVQTIYADNTAHTAWGPQRSMERLYRDVIRIADETGWVTVKRITLRDSGVNDGGAKGDGAG